MSEMSAVQPPSMKPNLWQVVTCAWKRARHHLFYFTIIADINKRNPINARNYLPVIESSIVPNSGPYRRRPHLHLLPFIHSSAQTLNWDFILYQQPLWLRETSILLSCSFVRLFWMFFMTLRRVLLWELLTLVFVVMALQIKHRSFDKNGAGSVVIIPKVRWKSNKVQNSVVVIVSFLVVFFFNLFEKEREKDILNDAGWADLVSKRLQLWSQNELNIIRSRISSLTSQYSF